MTPQPLEFRYLTNRNFFITLKKSLIKFFSAEYTDELKRTSFSEFSNGRGGREDKRRNARKSKKKRFEREKKLKKWRNFKN